jgi:hypothetical protein
MADGDGSVIWLIKPGRQAHIVWRRASGALVAYCQRHRDEPRIVAWQDGWRVHIDAEQPPNQCAMCIGKHASEQAAVARMQRAAKWERRLSRWGQPVKAKG